MNIKTFFQRWSKGIKESTILQQLHAKMIGHIGAILGGGMAIIYIANSTSWYFTIFITAIVFLQAVELVQTYQKCISAKNIEELIKEQSRER